MGKTETPAPKKSSKVDKHYDKRIKATQKRLEKFNESYVKDMQETKDLLNKHPQGYATLFNREDDCKDENS